MKPIPKIVGNGMLNDFAREVFMHLEEVKAELRRVTPRPSKNVGVNTTSIGTTFTAKAASSETSAPSSGGPARWS